MVYNLFAYSGSVPWRRAQTWSKKTFLQPGSNLGDLVFSSFNAMSCPLTSFGVLRHLIRCAWMFWLVEFVAKLFEVTGKYLPNPA